MTEKMNRTEFKETINAAKERVWELLFREYGEIHVHNPTMVSSNYLNGGSKGELGAVRHCKFSDKLFLDEKIDEVNGTHSFKVVVIEHNLPFVKHMSAIYELSSFDDETTELKMTSFNSFSPNFMKYLMRGQMAKSLRKHLFGLKYYAETGKTVNSDTYDKVHQTYACPPKTHHLTPSP
ncbi:SRPBCC family protein [Cognatishimia activa]|uniref:SRPBCC family protein n=1 Tax=Cognatishimia activa TaxID=1715691 RepID=UPI002232500F|nr:SRPBCC family protein [Cognatishimia activa]UZD92427.1 SRPBCC family protein [Cognatishimia activa]